MFCVTGVVLVSAGCLPSLTLEDDDKEENVSSLVGRPACFCATEGGLVDNARGDILEYL